MAKRSKKYILKPEIWEGLSQWERDILPQKVHEGGLTQKERDSLQLKIYEGLTQDETDRLTLNERCGEKIDPDLKKKERKIEWQTI